MWSKAKIMRLAERTLKRTEAYRENKIYNSDPGSLSECYQLLYVLVKNRKSIPDTGIVYAHWMDEMIMFDPFKGAADAKDVWDWEFRFDSDLFSYLEEGYELVGMSPRAHYAAWMEITVCHSDDSIDFLTGMQRYLDYCKRNQVTKEQLCEEFQYSGMDVMTLYDKAVR